MTPEQQEVVANLPEMQDGNIGKPHPNQFRNHLNMEKQVVPIYEKEFSEIDGILLSQTLVATKDIWHEKKFNGAEYGNFPNFWASLNKFPKGGSKRQRILRGELVYVPKAERNGDEIDNHKIVLDGQLN